MLGMKSGLTLPGWIPKGIAQLWESLCGLNDEDGAVRLNEAASLCWAAVRLVPNGGAIVYGVVDIVENVTVGLVSVVEHFSGLGSQGQ